MVIGLQRVLVVELFIRMKLIPKISPNGWQNPPEKTEQPIFLTLMEELFFLSWKKVFT